MELDYFEIEINGRIHPIPRKKFSGFDKSIGKTGYCLTVWDSTIEAVKTVIKQYNIKHISVATENIEYLNDPVFTEIEGVSIHRGGREGLDLTPLKCLKQLKFLEIYNEGKGKIDFNDFPDLIQLYGKYSKNYSKIETLSNLEYLYLTYYRRENLEGLRGLNKLKEIHLLFSDCKTLEGLESLKDLEIIKLEDCKKIRSLKGIYEKSNKLRKIEIRNCKNLKEIDFSFIQKQNILLNIDGKSEIQKKQKIYDSLNQLLTNFGNDEKVIEQTVSVLDQLKNSLTAENWEERLKYCVTRLNSIDRKYSCFYTEEREELIDVIQEILLEFDAFEVNFLIEEFAEW